MAPKLTPEAIVTLQVLSSKGQSNTQIAQTLGVTEGSIRYHLAREGQADGRANKSKIADPLAEVIDHWVSSHQPRPRDADEPLRPVNVRGLFDWLRVEHDYAGSYKSVLRFVRGRYPKPKLRPFRRVETPPGAQAQADWGTFEGIDIGSGPQTLYAFVLVLSHSRKAVLIWSCRMDQLAWHHVHTEAFRRLGGIVAVVRLDNLKTGISVGSGPWGQRNPAYQSYADSLGFHIDACLVRCPEDKGKVENKVGTLKRRLRLAGQHFSGQAGLQEWTDEELSLWDRQRLCPVTGTTVEASWLAEQAQLRPLPAVLPLAFDVALTRTVQKDCTIHFEGRVYSVPFVLCGLAVTVHGCAEVIQVLHEGRVVAEHPRQSRSRLLLDPRHYQGPGDERVSPPVPLGQMGQKLQEIWQLPVEARPVDLYAALAEVAR